MVLDSLIIGIPLFIVVSVLSSHFGHYHTQIVDNRIVRKKQLSLEVTLLIAFVVQGLYFSFAYGKGKGQSPGQSAPNIGVRDAATGSTIGFGRGLLRFAVRFALYCALVLPGLINDLSPLWDSRRQSFADKAAKTVVIRI
jgi:uncharacterized RDD family membrane protein YckC